MPMPVALAQGSTRVLWPEGLNAGWYLDVNRFSRQTAWAHGFMGAYALWLGIALVIVCFLAAYVVLWYRRDTHGVVLLAIGGAASIVAFGVNQAVGHAARELRPYDTYQHALVLVSKGNDYSFPSDHAVVGGALLVAILLSLGSRAGRRHGATARGDTGAAERRTPPAMVAIAVVASVLTLFLCFARVYVGAHYPGDVVAGLLLGGTVVVVLSATRPLFYRIAAALDETPLALVLHRPDVAAASARAEGRSRTG